MDERIGNHTNEVKVSIVVPVYNVSAYIERCLKSVMAQTYSNIECILVDDVTPDDSISICNRLISQYTGPISFTILRHEVNRGLSAARNTGTDVATGEYIYYLDSDDEIIENCIESLVAKVKKYPDVEMVQGGIESIPYMSHYDISPFSEIDFVDNNIWIRRNFYTFRRFFPVNVWGKLIKVSFLKENSLYNKEGLVHEDEQWMFFVVKVLKKLAFVHQKTYIHYVGTEGSIMSTSTIQKRAYHWSVILDDIVNNLDEPECKAQLMVYLYKFVTFYGNSGKVSYCELMKKYQQAAVKQNCYYLYILLFFMQITYPTIKGKGIRYLIHQKCYSEWNKIASKW